MTTRVCFAALALVCCAPAFGAQVRGRVSWTDRRGAGQPGSAHPARHVLIEICDVRLPVSSQVLGAAYTDEMGDYSASFAVPPGATRQIVVRARSHSPAATVQMVGTSLTYILASAQAAVASDQASLVVDVTGEAEITANGAFSVLDALLGARRYVRKIAGVDLPPLAVVFPVDDSVSYFLGNRLYILLGDRWDWDVIMHEYGHYVSRMFGLDDNPGGAHYFDENISDRLPKGAALRLAWGEGWPTFFAIHAQQELGMRSLGIPYVGDSLYSDTEDAAIDLDLRGSERSMGEDNEASVMRLLYQTVMESAATRVTAAGLWQALAAARPASLSAAYTAMTAGLSLRHVLAIGTIATRHRIAPSPSEPAALQALPEQPPTFLWAANGGGRAHPHNRFTVRFYNREFQPLRESPAIAGGTSYRPSEDEWRALRAADVCYWVVDGAGSGDPSTGPYISSARNLQPAQEPAGSQE